MSDLSRAKELILFLPRLAALIGRLANDPGVPAREKAILVAVLAYLISPIDVIPDFIPVLGQVDDLYLLALALLRFLNRSGEAKLREHWKGTEDIVALLREATEVAVRALPPRLRRLVERRMEEEERRGGAVDPGERRGGPVNSGEPPAGRRASATEIPMEPPEPPQATTPPPGPRHAP